ncbi:phospholipase D-like domain-containing protein [Flavobacterium oreochromis]|uniref:phospholipase D-like domain-containing protein n=1 Tax=Flavobacterium oreochromis TaxID=2906078 RepID=UPI003859BE7D
MKTTILSFISLFALNIAAQEVVQNNNFKISYNSKETILDTKDEVYITNVNDAFTNESIATTFQNNKTVITPTYPGQILKVEYNSKGHNQTEYIATKSASTGEIKVYFNHPVNTTVAFTGNNAVNLGNTLDDKLIEKINACTQSLDIAIYNSYSANSTSGIAGAINNAFNRGVQVRLIYDGSTSSPMIAHIDTNIPKVASPQGADYTIMHNKFVIFDANHSDATKPLVWTGSTNWTTAQIDGPDMNNVITIQDQALALGYKLEFEEMWGSSSMTPNPSNAKFGQYKTNNTPHIYNIGGKTIESYFSPSDGVTSKIVNAINTANNDLNIATMVITKNEIATAITNKFNSGVQNTNLVVDTQNPAGNDFPTIQSTILPNHAVTDVLSGIMHHKFLVVDNSNTLSDPLVLTGSHNWSSGAETNNDENTLIVHDANIANQYYQAFYYIYTQANGVLSINENLINDTNFNVFPNPFNNVITLKNSMQSPNLVEVSIFDTTGKEIFTKKINPIEEEQINLNELSNGIYFLNINSGKTSKKIKLIKR